MHINFAEISASAIAVYWFIRHWYGKLKKILDPVLIEIEQAAKDGMIDKKDRKAIAMKAVALLQANGKINLNFIERFMVSKAIDYIASRLPDFTVGVDAEVTVKNAIAILKVETNRITK